MYSPNTMHQTLAVTHGTNFLRPLQKISLFLITKPWEIWRGPFFFFSFFFFFFAEYQIVGKISLSVEKIVILVIQILMICTNCEFACFPLHSRHCKLWFDTKYAHIYSFLSCFFIKICKKKSPRDYFLDARGDEKQGY